MPPLKTGSPEVGTASGELLFLVQEAMNILSKLLPILVSCIAFSCTRFDDDESSDPYNLSITEVSAVSQGLACVSFHTTADTLEPVLALSVKGESVDLIATEEVRLSACTVTDTTSFAILEGLSAGGKYVVSVDLRHKGATLAQASKIFSVPDVAKIDAVPEPPIVDLGLSVKWAGWNLGATSESETGLRYAWGETLPRVTFTLADYTLTLFLPYLTKPYSSNPHFDAATAVLGDGWRTPTYAEMVELSRNCKWEPVELTDEIVGMRVTGPNGNSIVLPAVGKIVGSEVFFQEDYGLDDLEATGYYLTSSEGSQLYFQVHQSFNGQRSHSRSVYNRKVIMWYGSTIRPVHD